MGFILRKSEMRRLRRPGFEVAAARSSVLLFFIFSFIIFAIYSINLNYTVVILRGYSSGLPEFVFIPKQRSKSKDHREAPLPDSKNFHYDYDHGKMCPDYFHWIHEDLRPWEETGITEEMLERASRTAHFRLVILSGKIYVEKYKAVIQTRDVFTLWGILQLFKMYPGKVPDLDLIFDCDDWPVILSRDYIAPPPLFRYFGSAETLDIVFPDWSFWGWPEINIKPWGTLLKDLNEGNKKVNWMDREPYVYWKGNPSVSWIREDLMKCNLSDRQDWNARLYTQDWIAEKQKGYKKSNLADQCIHRYKIYIEGYASSVSDKYILACNSLTLLVTPRYYDAFTRGLVPLQHYWPIKANDKCKSIKFAVDWGNTHTKKAQKIGKAANDFISKNMTMEYVYDYMFHLLNEYAKLLRFKPGKPENAVEYCSKTMASHAHGLERKFMMESMVKYPSDAEPCILSPMNISDTQSFIEMKKKTIQQVEMWQNKYYEDQFTHL